jgi:hypothetical protein
LHGEDFRQSASRIQPEPDHNAHIMPVFDLFTYPIETGPIKDLAIAPKVSFVLDATGSMNGLN